MSAKRTTTGLLLIATVVAMLAGAPKASAQLFDFPATFAGDLWSRPRLTGDWFGLRDEMAKRGVLLDVDLLLTPQGVMTGGRDTGDEFWGNSFYTLSVDTQKAGLWPGGFLKVEGLSGFGSNVFKDSGATVPVNTAALLPKPDDQTSALMNATFIQFLSRQFGLLGGKISTVDTGGEFAGHYRTQFQNTGLVFPMALDLVPLSAYGGGVIGLPWENVILTALVLDPSGTPTNSDISEAFKDGFLVLGTAQVTIKPFGLVGHQNLYYTWSDKQRLSLTQDPANLARALLTEKFPKLGNPGPILERILERFFPQLLVPVQPANKESTTWAMSYGFDQYLWQPAGDPKRGIGVFFTFGASDGNPNPIKYSYNMGIGGNGVVPGRPNDNFGIGWARSQFSGDFVPLLRQKLGLGLDVENAVEFYYNASITPWLNVTADLQVVDSALNKTLNSNNQLVNMGTAVVGGLRMYVRF